MRLGLKRGTVVLLPHEKEWEESAREVIGRLGEILGDSAADIQHVGSTAIPSVCAKPIVDIALGMRSLAELESYAAELEGAGFIDRGEDQPGQRLYVLGDPDMRTHHIHAVVYGSEPWRNYLNFRDYMNSHAEAAAAYGALKKELAARYANERKAYTAGKEELIQSILRAAEAWRANGEKD